MSLLKIISYELNILKEQFLFSKYDEWGNRFSGSKDKKVGDFTTLQTAIFHCFPLSLKPFTCLHLLPSVVSKPLCFHAPQMKNIQFSAGYPRWRSKNSRISSSPTFKSHQHSFSEALDTWNSWILPGFYGKTDFLISFPLCRHKTECRKRKSKLVKSIHALSCKILICWYRLFYSFSLWV